MKVAVWSDMHDPPRRSRPSIASVQEKGEKGAKSRLPPNQEPTSITRTQESTRLRSPAAVIESCRVALTTLHYSPKTVKAYSSWVRRYIRFSGRRNPAHLGETEVSAFLSSLAVEGDVSASTQNQALAALLFLYKKVLGKQLDSLGSLVHAKRPQRLPVVLTREEVAAVLRQLVGTYALMGGLLYGGGLRLSECVKLRVKDVDLGGRQLNVRRGKRSKDRVTLLPQTLVEPLRLHLEKVALQHARDLSAGAGHVELPHALRRKYPNASREWPWQLGLPGESPLH